MRYANMPKASVFSRKLISMAKTAAQRKAEQEAARQKKAQDEEADKA